jgi:endonuclease G
MACVSRLLLASALLLAGATAPLGAQDNYPHLRLGNPSRATTDPGDRDNFLMKKTQFALAYCNDRGTANWVSWCLCKHDLGKAPRTPFYPDKTLPRGFRRIVPNDYTGSGFDRGHLCPHNDRADTDENSAATFVMTNMVPQAPDLNQKPWNDLESYCRDLVSRHHKRLYILAGPQGEGGRGKNGFRNTLANGRVTVPARCWKVIVVVPDQDGDDLGKISARTRVITVVMPNDVHVEHHWERYRTSVRQVEKLTGFTFFDTMPVEISERLKEKVDDDYIPAITPRPRER